MVAAAGHGYACAHEHHRHEDRRFDRRRRGPRGRAAHRVAQPGEPRRGRLRGPAGRRRTRSSTPAAPRARRSASGRRSRRPCAATAIQQIGRLVEDNKEALARLVTREIGKPYPESLGEVQEIIDTCDFFLSARAGASTARPCRARCRTSSSSPSATRWAWRRSSPPATSRWPCPPGTSCPAILCGNAVVWKPAEYAPALGDALAPAVHRTAACRTACSTSCSATARRAFEGLERALDERLVDKVGFTGSSRRRLARSASSAGATCSRPASSSAARTRSW